MTETLNDLEDEVLMAQVQHGSKDAFAVLVQRHSTRFYALAYRTVFHKAEAEDIVQEAFLKIWYNPALWKSGKGAKFTTWFYRVVLNLSIDHNKKKRAGALPETLEIIDEKDSIETILIEKETTNRVERAIKALPERQQAALNLCFYEGVSNKEAAAIMGIHLKALQSLLMRAKKQLYTTLVTSNENNHEQHTYAT